MNTGGNERARIDSSGNLLVGKTSTGDYNAGFEVQPAGAIVLYRTSGPAGLFGRTDNGEILRFTSNGAIVGRIGVVNSDRMFFATKDGLGLQLDKDNNRIVPCDADGAYNNNVGLGDSGLEFTNLWLSGTVNASYIAASNSVFTGSGGVGAMALKVTYSGADKFTVQNTGNVAVAGALSKGSGSFKIDHPLESKKDTHHLVHSFVEAPQADLIYRGVVVLENGTATINLDTVSGMSEGTYVLLNTNTSCFTSNETDWDAVKGSVSGNILTINCQNDSSTATVSWLVIGERQDQHMKDTDWTDDNGKVIVEPTK
jgi:hypothetical protein